MTLPTWMLVTPSFTSGLLDVHFRGFLKADCLVGLLERHVFGDRIGLLPHARHESADSFCRPESNGDLDRFLKSHNLFDSTKSLKSSKDSKTGLWDKIGTKHFP
jgi:hypothetical protein